jgi:outer membrane protein insertion porin family
LYFSCRGRWLYAFVVLLMLLPASGWAQEANFTVKKIKIDGLQRISKGTVYNYLPISVGDHVNAARIGTAVRDLFKTGFFRDVRMRRAGNTLIIVVKERPSIRNLTITGNKAIKTKSLKKVMKDQGIAVGRILDRSALDHLKQGLIDEYYSKGKYAAKVKTNVKPAPHNQVDVAVKISEGVNATIKSINIVGNHAFSEGTLLNLFKLKATHFLSFIEGDDKYEREKLVGDLESLRSYYKDRGYADFAITSTTVSISPNHKDIYITIGISEGQIYKVKSVKLAGKMVVPESQLQQLVLVRPGSTFSQKLVSATSDLISRRLGEDGYAFAKINPIPQLDHKNKTVALTFYIQPNERVYVRRITFNGAPGTDDAVFRREMRQMEGTWLSNTALKRSKIRLQRLPFVKKVEEKTNKVPGTNDMVDLDYDITERRSGTLTAGVGYGAGEGLILNGKAIESNFRGEGERLEVELNSSVIQKNYSVSYTQPYATINGISRTIGAFYRSTNEEIRGASPLDTDSIGTNLGFGYPISEYSSVNFGGTFSYSTLYANTRNQSLQPSPQEILDFATNTNNGHLFQAKNGPAVAYKQVVLNTGFTYDSRNRLILPQSGVDLDLSLQVATPPGDLDYYVARATDRAYMPLGAGFIFANNTSAAVAKPYGSTPRTPPFIRFFAGGPDSVRGYEEGYLGPTDSFGNPFGGNFRFYSQNELVLPVFSLFSHDKSSALSGASARVSAFFDVGDVFENPGDFRFNQLRTSVGIATTFLTPLGALKFSYAIPLNPHHDDRTQRFQFTVGNYF